MGRGGHHHNSHHHYRSGGTSDLPLGAYIIILVIALIIGIFITAYKNDKISNKEPIQEEIVITEYLYDNVEYFSSAPEDVISGLKYFYEKTGVQIVIYTTNGKVTDEYTKNLYYELFDDEGHVLIVLPIKLFGNDTQYYYIGDNSELIISDTTMNYLFEKINKSWSNKCTAWNESLIKTADLMIPSN